MKILVNDGLSAKALDLLSKYGFEVLTTKVAQEQVANYINKNQIDVILVRSSTKVTSEIINSCPTLKVIAVAGADLYNVDLNEALVKGIKVINATNAASQAVAELVFAHLLSGARFLYDSNRNMPLEGDTRFNELKSSYAEGLELKGKTLGIIGLGNVGKAVASMALAMGMKVIAADKNVANQVIKIELFNGQSLDFSLDTVSFDEVISSSDFITLHDSAQETYLLEAEHFVKMKEGVGIVNTSKGGLINEVALIDALEHGKVAFAGLDVFQDEPHPAIQVLMHPSVSLTPNIGALTLESQERISLEIAQQLIALK